MSIRGDGKSLLLVIAGVMASGFIVSMFRGNSFIERVRSGNGGGA